MSSQARLFHAALLASAACCLPQHAFAQSAAGSSEQPQATGGDIIVTAQRREEKQRDVPISITALNAEKLERSGVMSVLDLPRVTPGLELPQYGSWTQPAIRGITSAGADVGDSSNVAMYIDGVYQSNQTAQLMDLPDVEQIEVLKGPQGTLYGQNAEGGAIIINTRKPSRTFTGMASVSYGNYKDIAVRGFVSGPVSDTLAISLAGAYQDHEGYRKDIVRGGRDLGLRSKLVRGKVLWEPSSQLSFLLTGYWAKRADSSPFAMQALNGNTVALPTTLPLPWPTGPRPTALDQIALSIQPDSSNEIWGGSLKAVLDVGVGDLTSVSAISNTRGYLNADVDYAAANMYLYTIHMRSHFFTQDLNFVSRGLGPVTLTLGGFFMDGNDQSPAQTFTFYNTAVPTVAPAAPGALGTSTLNKLLKRKVIAGYGELAFQATDALTLSVGGRYTHEEQQAFSDLYGFGPFYGYGPGLAASPFNKDGKFNRFNPRVTARYALSPTANVYASYAQGFKSGLVPGEFSGATASGFTPAVKPEKLTAYEVGFKGQIVPGFDLNLAGFWYDFKDMQLQTFDGTQSRYQNVGGARVKGVEFDATLRLAQGLTVTAGGVYLDAQYRDFPNANVFNPSGLGGNLAVTIPNAAGLDMIRAPKFSGSVTANYSVDTGIGNVTAFGSVYYNDGSDLQVGGRVRQPSYTNVDAQISLKPAGMPNLTLSVYGRNLTDDLRIQSSLLSAFGDGASYTPPRTYGVKAEYRF